MLDVRVRIYIFSALLIVFTAVILLSATFLSAYNEQTDQARSTTISLADLLEQHLLAAESTASDQARTDIRRQAFIDRLVRHFPDYAVGYSESGAAPGVLHDAPPAPRKQVISTMRPLMQDGRIAGQVWAYRMIDDMAASYFRYLVRHGYLLLLMPLILLPGVSIIYRLFAVRNYSALRERQRVSRNKVIEAQENERKRISRELHDSIGQTLYSILVGLKILKNLKMEHSFREHLLEMEQMTDKAMDEVKRMALELRPSALDDLGLVPAIRSYVDRYQLTFNIQTDFKLIGHHRRYSQEIETALYRIVQEALTNAAKYSGTDRVELRMFDAPDKLALVIEDEGKGFQLGAKSTAPGLGLYGMKERAESVGGTIAIRSEPGKGTRIEVRVPYADVQAKGSRRN